MFRMPDAGLRRLRTCEEVPQVSQRCKPSRSISRVETRWCVWAIALIGGLREEVEESNYMSKILVVVGFVSGRVMSVVGEQRGSKPEEI
jgi:hypothetical protein